ncbi:MAG: DUF5112 domain-containing protein [Bacteroidales bacterium]|nr:DUF5112 domain-containing protein [Bacteroidales bacterium]
MTIIVLATMLPLVCGCRRGEAVDPLRRSVADGLNKEAFVNRYRQPDSCLAISERALRYIADSLPGYVDGLLRAHNNMAFACYQKSDREEALRHLDLVDRTAARQTRGMKNGSIEQLIANLLRARLLQRDCRIADSYRLLYDISSRRVLSRSRDNLLYNYAQTEYYIIMLVLNFHYREGKQADVLTLIDEVERRRGELKVDYAQDMALNYALAYAWQSAGESYNALDYCDATLGIMERSPQSFCTFNYANTLQMMALALRSLPGTVPPDSVLDLYDRARQAFFDYGDPYQMLGGTVSTARYALLCGDTAFAHQVLGEWRSFHGLWQPFAAPKMELGYFDVLLRSRMADSPDQSRLWYERHAELQERVTQFEKEDFFVQQSLADATRRSRWMSATATVVTALLVLLLAVLAMLWRNTRRLRCEKQQLEAAKRRDVERIANVETCLSVLRHDVSPYIAYLGNESLPAELRGEVTSQLVRTFDNIKNWTRLSIPSGLVFNASSFSLQEVFDEVGGQLMRPADGVSLVFEPTPLSLHADRLLVTILLRNLLANAISHTPHGSITVAAAADEDGMAVVTVADTGEGMTQEQLDALFRADREIHGEHGFGLILCRYIIKKHDDLTRRGCRIWAESEPGRGTSMHVRLAMTENNSHT